MSSRFVALCVVFAFACIARDEVSSTSSKIVNAPSQFTGMTQGPLRSVSAVWSFAPPPPASFAPTPIVTAGYEDLSDSIKNSVMGWSFSVDGTGQFTKVKATATNSGGACSPVANHETNVPPALRLLGQPSLAADGLGHVVYTMRASDKSDLRPNRIAAAISNDGGMTFENVVVVNDDQCSNNVQDMPYATFDTTTQPPTLWVVWRHQGNSSIFSACERHGTLDFTSGTHDQCGFPLPVIAWLDQGRTVDHTDSDFGLGANSIGGVMIQAGDGAATVVYSGNDQRPDSCSGFKSTNTKRMSWGSVTSFDDGKNWTQSQPSFFEKSSSYRWCVLDHLNVPNPSIDNPSFLTGLRDFGFVRASNGRYYAAVHDSRASIRLFESSDKGIHWREFCPNNQGSPVPGVPFTIQASPWLPFGADACPTPAVIGAFNVNLANPDIRTVSLAWPTLATDGELWQPMGNVSPPPASGQHKSRVFLSFLQGNPPLAATDAAFDDTFNAAIVVDTDPISPNRDGSGNAPSNNVLQPVPPPITLAAAPQGTRLDGLGPSTTATGSADFGDYMSLAPNFTAVACTDQLLPNSIVDQLTCAAASVWPFYPMNNTTNGVGLRDNGIGASNPQ